MAIQIPNIIVFDIETGGFFTEEHKYGVAEFAAIAINGQTGQELGRIELIVAPYKTYNGELTQYTNDALKVNGLTINKIESGTPASQAISEIKAFIGAHKVSGKIGAPVLAGHNIDSFDIPYVDQFFDLHKQDLGKFISNFTLDTMWWARLAHPQGIENHKLGTVAAHLGIDLIDAHRAMADVEANTEVVRKYLQMLQGIGTSYEANSSEKQRYRQSFQM